MNYPESALLTGLISAIQTELPARTIYTVPSKDAAYPHIFITQTDMQETGSKAGFIYRFEPLVQVIHKDITKLELLLSDMNAVHQVAKNGADITVPGYTTLRVELINTNRTRELYDWGKLEIGLIRLLIEIY